MLLTVLLVLVQAVLPLLGTASYTAAGNGQTVWICTLQGLQQILVDAEDDEEISGPLSPHCPTCSLGQLFAGVIPSATTPSQTQIKAGPPFLFLKGNTLPYFSISPVRVRAPPVG